jgi:hypothetical protein
MIIKNAPGLQRMEEMVKVKGVSRRSFLQIAGGITGAGLVLASCKPRTPGSDVYIGQGDVALLNFLYILQQLEAYYYTQAVATPYYTLNQPESDCLTDLRDQEIAHCQFFKTLLGASAIPNIVINFSNVTFTDRTSLLTNAAILEDLVISGFNGAAALFKNTDYALTVSKMVSVEARHSAYCRDILDYNYTTAAFNTSTQFAPASAVSTVNGVDMANSPSAVLAIAQNYIQTTFDSSKLPS